MPVVAAVARPLPPLVVRCPLLLPAVAVVAGAWGAARLPFLPVPLLVALLAAGLGWGRRLGVALAWLAVGLLWAEVHWVTPRTALLAVDRSRPVTMTGEVAGCWSAEEEGTSAWL